MWRAIPRPRNIASRSLQLPRRSNSQWRPPPRPAGSQIEHPAFIDLLLNHKATVLLSAALCVAYWDYSTQKRLADKPDIEFLAIWALFATKAADKSYDQVDFDDPAQVISYYKKLQGHLFFDNALDMWLAKLEDDPRRKEEVYTICRQAAKDIRLAIHDYKGKDTVELARRVYTISEESRKELIKLKEAAGITQ